jgi:hypothetical protein
MLSDVWRFDKTRVLEENSLLGLGNLNRDRVGAVRTVEDTERLALEAEKRMAEVLSFRGAGQRQTDFSEARQDGSHLNLLRRLFRELVNSAARIFGHTGQCVGMNARFKRGCKCHSVHMVKQVLAQRDRGRGL